MTIHRRASLCLVVTTVIWGLSFPLTRGLAIAQQAQLPVASTWFLTAATVAVRFGVSGLILLVLVMKSRIAPTFSEWKQGIGLALFASGGLLFQNDGLFYTTASVSAFLTGAYCAIIPLYGAIHCRKLPTALELFAVIFVMVGVAILSGVRWNELRLGRGEMETLVCSIFFAGQILWLERKEFEGNRPVVFSTVMFLAIALFMTVFTGFTVQNVADFGHAFSGWPSQFLVGCLTLACTLFTFTMMNRWQPHVSATEAGLIYCLEPVFAAGFALFVPGLLAKGLNLPLENESFSQSILLGGTAILLANLVMLFAPKKAPLLKVGRPGLEPGT